MDTLKLVVYTPSGLAFEDTARSVKLMTAAGEIGILPGHTRYVGVLGKGTLEYEQAGASHPKRVLVTGGFCSFNDGELKVLADGLEGEIPTTAEPARPAA